MRRRENEYSRPGSIRSGTAPLQRSVQRSNSRGAEAAGSLASDSLQPWGAETPLPSPPGTKKTPEPPGFSFALLLSLRQLRKRQFHGAPVSLGHGIVGRGSQTKASGRAAPGWSPDIGQVRGTCSQLPWLTLNAMLHQEGSLQTHLRPKWGCV